VLWLPCYEGGLPETVSEVKNDAMRARLITAVSMISGLLALLICMATPGVAAAAMHHMPMSQAHASMPSDMPCCPEKAPVSKTCGQQCPILAEADFSFHYMSRALALSFASTDDRFAGLSYSPQVPPPR
jgi:hypothetical protein